MSRVVLVKLPVVFAPQQIHVAGFTLGASCVSSGRSKRASSAMRQNSDAPSVKLTSDQGRRDHNFLAFQTFSNFSNIFLHKLNDPQES